MWTKIGVKSTIELQMQGKKFMSLSKKKKKLTNKADFKARKIIRNKEEHYIMLKRPIFQEDITIINAYASDIRSSKSGKVKMTEMRNGLMRNT